MQRKKLGLAVHQLGREGLKCLDNSGVELLSGSAQQAAVSRLLDQRMLKGINRIGRRTALKYQLRSDETSESRLQFVVRKAGNCPQQRERELAAYGRADLRHLPHRPETVQACRQRVVQTRRDREWRQC